MDAEWAASYMGRARSAPLTAARNHILAFLVIFHLIYVGVAPFKAAPILQPGQGTPVQQAFQPVAKTWNAVRKTVSDRGRWYRWLGVRQTWYMFGSVGRSNGRVEIAYQVQGQEQWRYLFIERSSRYAWKRHVFEQYRWREMLKHFHREKERYAWRRFADWIAPKVFAEFPEAQRVRIRVRKAKTPPIAELRKTRQLEYKTTGWKRIVERPE